MKGPFCLRVTQIRVRRLRESSKSLVSRKEREKARKMWNEPLPYLKFLTTLADVTFLRNTWF